MIRTVKERLRSRWPRGSTNLKGRQEFSGCRVVPPGMLLAARRWNAAELHCKPYRMLRNRQRYMKAWFELGKSTPQKLEDDMKVLIKLEPAMPGFLKKFQPYSRGTFTIVSLVKWPHKPFDLRGPPGQLLTMSGK